MVSMIISARASISSAFWVGMLFLFSGFGIAYIGSVALCEFSSAVLMKCNPRAALFMGFGFGLTISAIGRYLLSLSSYVVRRFTRDK